MRNRPSFIYRLSMRLAQRALPLAARFDKKVARGVDARRGVLERLTAWARAHRDPKQPLVWVHAPSVGEGLQAKPVLETLRAERPQWQLVYTFFSPSAERLARTLPVDLADYLPFDRPGDVAAALEALQPSALVFSKVDVWPELTLAARRRGTRLGLISATVALDSSRLRWPARRWAEPAYRALDRVGTISEDDGRRLQQLGTRREVIEVTGDTRTGVAVIEGIWWHRFHRGGRGVNVLTSDRVSDLGGGPALHSNLVEIERVGPGDRQGASGLTAPDR